ncbi:hydrogenase expression/formation protein HypE [Methylotenera sp.]|uniref:hydrogenase expression/formation protein HypE n=1 Tax=Methylotenera sp. TaxID=2051956 RepID=UPI00272FE19B|nr:hydrogenase expression/formation protein HypE [Methylotenera sp.]MDP2072062.1 hydrogenase expression/formation protein HypE [Methylotenera sp.]MDP3006928.1 hydrogenase expression/formation protein HypE [Methylotenera sp.]MDP3007135.1 hydrogenase expression/formation protein HypE [Methylotenera sp.]
MSKAASIYIRPLDLKNGRIDMSHGSGGRASAQLIETMFAAAFDNEYLRQGNDAAVLPSPPPGSHLVMSTDAHVVSPLFFPGGNIGSLSVHGTVNDLAMMGACPLWLSASFILEEGFPLSDLLRIVNSMAQAAKTAGVAIVTGDTKVVERGKGDGVYISTTGVGYAHPSKFPAGNRARDGDVILLSGTIGDHGMAIMSQREGLQFESAIESDSAALHELVAAMLTTGADVRVLRDPTRGGLATTLNEIARQSGVGMILQEDRIPIHPQVAAACEFLGLDPLYVANEGKLVAICAEADVEKLLTVMRAHPLARSAAKIGAVIVDDACFVQMKTKLGGRRMVDWLSGDQLPRIC